MAGDEAISLSPQQKLRSASDGPSGRVEGIRAEWTRGKNPGVEQLCNSTPLLSPHEFLFAPHPMKQ